MEKIRYFLYIWILIIIYPSHCLSQEKYTWDNVTIGGGGFVTGIAIHPKEPDLIYIRTDVGGLFKWNKKFSKWEQLLDWVEYNNVAYRNVDGLVLDPNNPDIVYITAGKDVLKSVDRGKTWKNTGLGKVFMGNGDDRWKGENIAVDPVNSNILCCGTRNDGLYYSSDAANTWQSIVNVPSGKINIGIRSIVFDAHSIKNGKCQVIYIGLPGVGIYRSNDAGKSFEFLQGSPLQVNRMAVTTDGALVVTHDAGISKFKGDWSDISPNNKMDFCGLAIDPQSSQHYVAAESRTDCLNAMFQTLDGGATWQEIKRKIHFETAPGWFTYDPKVAEGIQPKQTKWTYFAAAVSALAFDPFTPGKLFFSDWYAIWWTNNVNASVTEWFTNEKGHEETVVLLVVSPSKGCPLFTLMADNVGFRHNNINDFPSQRLSDKAEGISLDYCEKSPSNIVMVDAEDWWGKNTRLLISNDSGRTMTVINKPQGKSGRVAYSSVNSNNIVYLPAKNNNIYFTEDRGTTWNIAKGLPANILDREYVFNYNQPLAADKVDGAVFYIFNKGKFFRSSDGGKNWSGTKGEIPEQEGDNWVETSKADPTTEYGFVNVKTAPRLKGAVWVSLGKNGLWASSNGGEHFDKDSFFEIARCLAWGKSAPGDSAATAFVYGTHDHQWGLFRSVNRGKTWQQINDKEHSLARPYAMDGDKNVFGRIYISIGGRGVMCGKSITDIY